MPILNLTEKSVTRLQAPDPSGRQSLYWDDELRGFGVLVSGVSNAKSYIVQRALTNGKTRRVTIAPTNTIKLNDAAQRAREILADFYRGIDPKAKNRRAITLREALDDYLKTRSDLRARSVANYKDTTNRYLSKWLDMPLRDVTREAVEDRLREIANGVANGGKGRGHATANAAMRTLRVVYNFAADRASPTEPMPPNPVRLKKIWLPVPRRTRSVPFSDLPIFYKAVVELPNAVARDYLLLMLFTGLRRREASTLQWENIDFADRIIRLPATSTKSGQPLDLPMSGFVHGLLVARRNIGNAKWVFPSSSASGHIEEPRHPLDLVREKCGINISAHDLRRTFITVAESTDMSILALKALVNHALGKDVTEGYVQMSVERLREPVQRVCDKIESLCEIVATQNENVTQMRR